MSFGKELNEYKTTWPSCVIVRANSVWVSCLINEPTAHPAISERAFRLTQSVGNEPRAGSPRGFPITKDAIFNYVYAVLHDPIYRETYAINLKREFPRIPFYPDFWQWADWGRGLLGLHLGYETSKPYPLQRTDVLDEKSRKAGLTPKVLLRADKAAGIIQLDSETQLSGIPAAAWTYQLGNRSAVEWILDQHRQREPKDSVIRQLFNSYRFSDHKEEVIELLTRVAAVSVETMRIVDAMRRVKRSA